MARQLQKRWKWVALVVLLQVTLLISLAVAQTDSDSANRNWQSTESRSPLINVAGPARPWHQEPREALDELAPDNPPGQTIASEPAESESHFLTRYFEMLDAEYKAKFSWNPASEWWIVAPGLLRGELTHAQNPTTAKLTIRSTGTSGSLTTVSTIVASEPATRSSGPT